MEDLNPLHLPEGPFPNHNGSRLLEGRLAEGDVEGVILMTPPELIKLLIDGSEIALLVENFVDALKRIHALERITPLAYLQYP